MARKSRKNMDNEDEEVIIGYNTKRKKDKPPKKKRKEKSKWRKIKKALFIILKIILVFAILIGIGAFLFVSPVFNITEIKVENASKISENTYLVLSDIQIGENIFRINKSKIREQIKTESYVEDVEIIREFPGTVLLTVTERTPKYIIEKNGGMYIYIDEKGYYLEANTEKLDIPILRGIATDLENLNPGDRILEEDLEKFNDLIKITDGIRNNQIGAKVSLIDISDEDNYILEFASNNKKVMLGNTYDLSTKMGWIKYFMEQGEEGAGTIYLNTETVYFKPDV